MPERLTAWLYGTPVADLLPARDFRITLQWRDEGIDRWGRGSTTLSVGLPLGSMTGPRDMRGLDFFENILPEGPALAQMATLAGTRPADTYGVLSPFGRDCAGAIVLLPEGEEPSSTEEYEYAPLADDGLRELINSLDTAPLGMAPERGHMGQRVGGERDIEKTTAAHLVEEAATWGIRRPTARKTVSDTLDRVISAIPAASGDERVLGIIRSRAEKLARAAED